MNNQTMRLAIEAGFLDGDLELFPETIERFAELVRQDLIAMYKQALTDPENQPSQYGTVTLEYMEHQIALEREACAKLCEKFIPSFDDGVFFAKVIRARGEK